MQFPRSTYFALPARAGILSAENDIFSESTLIVGRTLTALVGACALNLGWAGQVVDVRTISSRPDAVSGDEVLVQISVPTDSRWIALLNSQDVTQAFLRADSTGKLLARLTGLKLGKNTLEIRTREVVGPKIEMINHPITGPIFSGPHQEPFICQTVANGLGPALDSDCSAKTLVQYYYKSTEAVAIDLSPEAPALAAVSLAPGFKPYDTSGPPPTDVARTVTSSGLTVPYIVRREFGVINRAVYDIQFLHKPGYPLPTPWSHPTPGWNGRLVYFFDGGCGGGYRQGTFIGAIGMAQEPFLAQGYATATSTLNRFANNCNDRLSAESLSMVKEHFIKQYGEPVHTIGWGDSGGAMELHLAAQNYPGLFDGIIPYLSLPDMTTATQSVTDCALLDHAFNTSKMRWTEEQKAAVSGFATWGSCVNFLMNPGVAPFVDPRGCDPIIPKKMIYDRRANPKGARCDIFDNEVNVFGRDHRTGFARRPLDNIGVQYGLAAFLCDKIDAEQFVELNERVGGLDEDAHIVASRAEADAETLRIAYERGLVLTGGGGLSQIPIIEWRPYADDLVDSHDRFRSFVTRARLTAANGTADNQVLLVYPRYSIMDSLRRAKVQRVDALFPERARELVRQMDRWLDSIAKDAGTGTQLAKVARNKPADLADSCWAIDGERIAERAAYDGLGRCNQLYPPHADPRIAAGGPLTDDVLKCALKPVSPADYPRLLTTDQMERLKVVFPSGVCDYTRPGVGQDVTTKTWQRYEDVQY